MAAPSSATPKPPTSTGHVEKLFNSDMDSRISRMNRVLSTAAGIDSTLLLTGYSLAFVSAQLNRLVNTKLEAQVMQLVASALPALAPGETRTLVTPVTPATSRLADMASSAKTISGMCSDVRCFMRLWGLLKIWAGAKATYAAPPRDLLMRLLAWGQLGSMAAYLVLEHGFYLASKGVLKGWAPARIAQWFRMSIYVFGAYLVMDFARLLRSSQLQSTKTLSEKTYQEIEAEKTKDAAWWRSLQVDVAYSPLCFEWGLDGGMGLGDAWVGMLGAWAGWTGFREQWRISGL